MSKRISIATRNHRANMKRIAKANAAYIKAKGPRARADGKSKMGVLGHPRSPANFFATLDALINMK